MPDRPANARLAVLATLFALAAGVQGLAAAPAAAMTSEGELGTCVVVPWLDGMGWNYTTGQECSLTDSGGGDGGSAGAGNEDEQIIGLPIYVFGTAPQEPTDNTPLRPKCPSFGCLARDTKRSHGGDWGLLGYPRGRRAPAGKAPAGKGPKKAPPAKREMTELEMKKLTECFESFLPQKKADEKFIATMTSLWERSNELEAKSAILSEQIQALETEARGMAAQLQDARRGTAAAKDKGKLIADLEGRRSALEQDIARLQNMRADVMGRFSDVDKEIPQQLRGHDKDEREKAKNARYALWRTKECLDLLFPLD